MTDTAIDSAQYRKVLGQFATGVTIVTTAHGDELSGMTVGSFTSVSIAPPLVGFLPMKDSGTLELVEKSGSFCVNILSSEQEALCMIFATPGEDRFAGLEHKTNALGDPIFKDCLGWIHCTVHEIIDAGDHMFVMGLVKELELGETDVGPLVFYGGGFGNFTAV